MYIVPDIYREKVYINICEYKKPTKVADSSSEEEEEDESSQTGESRLRSPKGSLNQVNNNFLKNISHFDWYNEKRIIFA